MERGLVIIITPIFYSGAEHEIWITNPTSVRPLRPFIYS